MSGTDGALPNLVIIGAAKCGTTSLHEYLSLHPQVFMSHRKELKFFNHEGLEQLAWYRSHFRADVPVRGESSPTYAFDPWFPGVPERMRALIPDARLVYLVRDPVDRLVAQYVELRSLSHERRPFAEAVADFDAPSNKVVMASRYAHQLERYLDHFPAEHVLVVDQVDLLRSRAETLREVFAFLGVDPDFTTPAFDAHHNVRSSKRRLNAAGELLHRRGWLRPLRERSRVLPDPVRERTKALVSAPVPTPALDPALEQELRGHLRAEVDRLRALTGKPFAHWSL